MPTGWDSKYRSGVTSVPDSPTYKNENTRVNAIDEIERAILSATNLSPELRAKAIANIRAGNFITSTVGAGRAKNTVETKYCGFKAC